MHTNTGTPTHEHIDNTKLNIQNLKRGANRLERGEDSSIEWKTSVLRFDLNESWKGFCQRRRGRLFLVEGPKTKKVREPTVDSLVRGIRRLRVSEAEQRVREGV